MTSDELRKKFLEFFEKKGHKIIPSSSLIPENDSSVLFTTAGMQQFKKYYTDPEQAEKDFGTKNVASIQKCLRTSDIDEVGDASHLTFFEMLGNFSFGGYGRKEAIGYAYDFIVQELGLEISYVTIYRGSENVPRDNESEEIWKAIKSNIKIVEEGEDVFWGPTGDSGPCGPTTEIYCRNSTGEDVEIWNIVFNEYFCLGSREQLDKGEVKLEKLPILGVDTGMGFERLLTIVNQKESVYETDLFNREKTKEERIIADHLRSAESLIVDGVGPSNTGAGYVLRRLIRRAVRFSKEPLKTENKEIKKEEEKFRETLERGIREFGKGIDPFILFTSYGFPIELTEELAKEKGQKIDREDFDRKMKEHQKLSQTASAGMFKGGLSSTGAMETKYHTATHLLLATLRQVLGPEIFQRGSNITSERLRFDFNYPQKLTAEQVKQVEDLVNQKIQEKIPVVMEELPKEEALKISQVSFDPAKYGEIVQVYKINDFSIELCGGPHVKNTAELGTFKITKEEASAQGIRRIKAELVV